LNRSGKNLNTKDIKFWSDVCEEIMEESHLAVTPLVGTTEAGKIVKMGADGTPTKYIDLVAENKVLEVLECIERPLIVVSEEIGEVKIGDGQSEVMLVVDPLDGTSNAVKNIPAYGISVAVAPILSDLRRPLTIQDVQMGVVKNFATGDVYCAIKGEGAFMNNEKLLASSIRDLSQSSLGAYVYRMDMDKIEKLCKTVRRMRILGSIAIELCYVAEGIYDAFVDISDNLRVVDISAAKVILEESGGVVTDQYGQALQGKLNVLEKTSLIAACNSTIHKEIIRILGGIQ
jgi:myo-inositol-1(or 4)-monophosphatase